MSLSDSGIVKDALQIASAAVDAVRPQNLIPRKVRLDGNILSIGERRLSLDAYENIYVIGAGKASASMALELEKILGNRISGGVISTKYGHSVDCKRIKIMESGHPVLDQNGLNASEEIYKLALKADDRDLVICLFSGGGSALLERLPLGIDLPNLQKVFEVFLKCGANIEETNTVRKHLSSIKGGRLARAVFPATCVSLILSDVIGDSLESIASGPTAPDPTTFKDALDVIAKYKTEYDLPEGVLHFLKEGLSGEIEDTPKSGDKIFDNVSNIILGNNLEALIAARREATKRGYNALILSSCVQGETKEIAKFVAAVVQEIHMNNNPVAKPGCILFGGETTLKIQGSGKGGRNQEFALASLIAMRSVIWNYVIASCGTDGTDGPTDAAGAFATPEIAMRSEELGLNPLTFLNNNDSYNFFEKVDGLIKTGVTGTNVMDIVVALVQEQDSDL